MSSSDAAPPTADHDPATTITHDTEVTQEEEKKDHKPRDSKGWDGKLRLDKRVLSGEGDAADDEADAQSDAEESEEEAEEGVRIRTEDGPPPEQIAADDDLLEDMPEDEEDIDLVHCRISDIPALRLERFKKLRCLCLRQNQISYVEIPEELASTLKELDLYDNLIAHIKGFDAFTELTSLDLSFNKIKHIKRINHLTKLTELFFVQNKISTIEGVDGLTNLKSIEFGANRIREIQNLDTLTNLESLWLGKNKITQITNLDSLTNLKLLSIQSNRLTSITGLENLVNLEDLHISHNLLTSISGLEKCTKLQTIDISNNPIEHLSGLETLEHLQELWASYCKIGSFQEVEKQLGDKKELQTVYFEGNPLQLQSPALYRKKVMLALPQIIQIDATFVKQV